MFHLFVYATPKTNGFEKRCACKADTFPKSRKTDEAMINFEISIYLISRLFGLCSLVFELFTKKLLRQTKYIVTISETKEIRRTNT